MECGRRPDLKKIATSINKRRERKTCILYILEKAACIEGDGGKRGPAVILWSRFKLRFLVAGFYYKSSVVN